MYRASFTLFLGFIYQFALLNSATVHAEEAGDFRTEHVEKAYLFRSDPVWDSAGRIERFIRSEFPDREKDKRQLATSEIARQIAVVSKCFQIDPYIYAALIRVESGNYDQFVSSPTGAVGLTQFTPIAIKEVHDQLGARGDGNAREQAIEYFRSVIESPCIENELLGGKAFLPIFERREGRSARETLKQDTTAALVYGAILMKTGLSVVQEGGATSCDRSGRATNLTALYRKAVHKYNADPKCSVQRWYASKVMDEFYPKILKF